jgi:enamine deaminase RidA (YjgF/YER057c/UK114 family)
MKTISTPNAPTPAGHYSQAVVYGGVVYVAGMLGIDPDDPGSTRTTRTRIRAGPASRRARRWPTCRPFSRLPGPTCGTWCE